VHESIHAQFVDAFVAEVERFRLGDPLDEATYLGPITRRAQLDVLKQQIAEAKKLGGKVLTGGRVIRQRGNWFEPTVVVDVDSRMQLMRDESFGPVIGIQRVASDDEAIALMNDNEYGLTAGVYTQDGKRARRLLDRLEAGSVYWNCCDRVSPRLPWSGVKKSGIGLTLSTYGIQAFTRPKAWHLRSA
jgi:acyl-CoA reductase-like NAD-dependent aldehyde dehydrogenase